MASTTAAAPPVNEPIPIFKVAHKYLLYDVNHITYLRAQHHILGVLIGSLPQAPQQNVFQGIPLELMPEEARLLCEKGVGYIVDDVEAHRSGFLGAGLGVEERKRVWESLRARGKVAGEEVGKRAEERRRVGLERRYGDWNDVPEDMLTGGGSRPGSRAGGAGRKKKGPRREVAAPVVAEPGEKKVPVRQNNSANSADAEHTSEDELLFSPPSTSDSTAPLNPNAASQPPPTSSHTSTETLAITPTTSYPPLTAPPPPPNPTTVGSTGPTTTEPTTTSSTLPPVPPSYPLFRHLHENSYFLTPGLRFGCHYTAYPGDPLRFHSHFLCRGVGWEKEVELKELVGGGRLGTGVKKGFLIGGEVGSFAGEGEGEGEGEDGDEEGREVRTFCVEWGGM
ncbi:hypothetical protein B0A50_00471 [Salinomyces thailandicus]|uniref:tRNA-intron lyase n=1 Tax=Salinomyces thailandicus TaxID=706561 RepID=A0A4U0UGM2_9PEZI|nr:hypothetical protein B0A50_00471 [Salinomyces thailandica]